MQFGTVFIDLVASDDTEVWYVCITDILYIILLSTYVYDFYICSYSKYTYVCIQTNICGYVRTYVIPSLFDKCGTLTKVLSFGLGFKHVSFGSVLIISDSVSSLTYLEVLLDPQCEVAITKIILSLSITVYKSIIIIMLTCT